MYPLVQNKLLIPLLWGIFAGAAAVAAVAPAAAEIAVSPAYAQLVAGQTLQFGARLSARGETHVVWQVDNRDGGDAASGTITPSGLYTAPKALPDPALVTVTAVNSADRTAPPPLR